MTKSGSETCGYSIRYMDPVSIPARYISSKTIGHLTTYDIQSTVVQHLPRLLLVLYTL